MDDRVELTPPARDTETKHFPNFDAVLNLGYPDQEKARGLLEQVKNGIPSSWRLPSALIPIIYPGRNIFDVKDPHILVDDEKNPKFVAKIKRHIEPVRRAGLSSKDAPGFNSISNELNLSKDVKKILSTDKAKQIVEQYGFDQVALVEPIVGTINKSTGQKVLYYDYIHGDTIKLPIEDGRRNKLQELADALSSSEDHENSLEELTNKLRGLFKGEGISATDLTHKNLLSSRDDGSGRFTLYLIDIEGYYKT